MNYRLPDDYVAQAPMVYSESATGESDLYWQPDVYEFAASVARAEGATRIIDLGCSTAGKLLALVDEFDVVGLDLAGNIASDQRGTWIVHDLDSGSRLPVGRKDLEGSVVVCSDVIEHLVTPERLVAKLRYALTWAACAVISTPDRERTRGVGDLGPPDNPWHAREWTAGELVEWLESEGLTISEQAWQRSYMDGPDATVVVVACL